MLNSTESCDWSIPQQTGDFLYNSRWADISFGILWITGTVDSCWRSGSHAVSSCVMSHVWTWVRVSKQLPRVWCVSACLQLSFKCKGMHISGPARAQVKKPGDKRATEAVLSRSTHSFDYISSSKTKQAGTLQLHGNKMIRVSCSRFARDSDHC